MKTLKITKAMRGASSADDILSIVRPVGMFRFLGPMDVLQKGDFYRVCPQSIEEDNEAPYNYNYSPLSSSYWGAMLPLNNGQKWRMSDSWEFIRPIPDESTTVPLFEIKE